MDLERSETLERWRDSAKSSSVSIFIIFAMKSSYHFPEFILLTSEHPLEEFFHENNFMKEEATPSDLSYVWQTLVNPGNFNKVFFPIPILEQRPSFRVALMSMLEYFSELNLMAPSRNVFFTMWSWYQGLMRAVNCSNDRNFPPPLLGLKETISEISFLKAVTRLTYSFWNFQIFTLELTLQYFTVLHLPHLSFVKFGQPSTLHFCDLT